MSDVADSFYLSTIDHYYVTSYVGSNVSYALQRFVSVFHDFSNLRMGLTP